LTSEYADIRIGLARIEIRLGHLGEARARLRKVLEGQPTNVDALLAAALASATSGETAAAIQYLEKARRLSPGYKEVGQVLARVRQGARSR
jgi:Tfp pilus assembly protein PilF